MLHRDFEFFVPGQIIYNEYLDRYIELMNTRLDSPFDGEFGEMHHSIPKSFGGVLSAQVRLSWREHLEAHFLLVKFTSGKARRSMGCALRTMFLTGRNLSRKDAISEEDFSLYEEAKRLAREAQKGLEVSEETRKKISEALTGKKRKPFSEEHKRRLSEASARSSKGRKFSEESRKKMSESRKLYLARKQAIHK